MYKVLISSRVYFSLKVGGVVASPNFICKNIHNIVIQNGGRNVFGRVSSPNFNLPPTLMTAKSL